MTTISVLVDQAISEVYSESRTFDVTSYLSAAIDTDDLTLTLSSAKGFSPGAVQVEDELLLVDSVNRSTNALGVVSGNRGALGTTAASHAAGVRVVMSPTITRHRATRAVGDAIKAASGLFAVASTTFTYNAAQLGYTLPAGVDQILSVSWLPPDPGLDQQPVRSWHHDRFTAQVVLRSPIMPGCTVRVDYAKAPTVPTLSQEFSVSGLPESCEDVIRLAACWRLTSSLEPSSLMPQSAEAAAMGRQFTPGLSRARVAQMFAQMYQIRLAEEVSSLQSRYPIRSHWGR